MKSEKFRTVLTVVALIGTYVICQAIADIGATKIADVAGIFMPGGTFIFALTFTLRDMIHKRLGKEWAIAAILTAGVLNILQAVYLGVVARIPSAPFFAFGEAWSQIFFVVPAITIGSIAAEMISEYIDTEVYHQWKKRLANAPQWTRVLVSNAISLPVDSLVFALLGFVLLPPLFGGEALPFSAAWHIVSGQILYKGIVTIVSMPGIYLVKEKPLDVPSVG